MYWEVRKWSIGWLVSKSAIYCNIWTRIMKAKEQPCLFFTGSVACMISGTVSHIEAFC